MTPRARLRLFVLRVLVLSILATLFGRLWYLQVYAGPAYRKAASQNRIRDVVNPAPRGQIFDDTGRPLVRNRTALVVSVNRSLLLRAPHRGRDVLARLAAVVNKPAADILRSITPCGERLPDKTIARSPACWNGSPYQPVPVKDYATDDPAETSRVLAIMEHQEDFPGVTAQFQAVREYPQKTLAAHLLGYLGAITVDERKKPAAAGYLDNALVGRTGVEQTYDRALHGQDGVQKLQVDKDGNVTGSLGQVPSSSGDQLVLSVDAGIQRVAETALAQGIDRARGTFDKVTQKNLAATSGSVVVLQPSTGRIVAMASYPTYDPTSFVGGISSKEFSAKFQDPAAGVPLLDRSVGGLFAPGSTFKVVSTPAAVQAGNSLYGQYDCTPDYRVGTSVFHNFEGEAFGHIDFRTTLVRSCDTVYYRLAYDQWLKDGGYGSSRPANEFFPKMAKAWGFGTRTGVDLSGESRGVIADRGYKRRFWEQNKAAFCKGAHDPRFTPYVQAIEAENCATGYQYRAGDLVNFAIGQGDVLVTPLQLASAYGALANGGTLYAPRVAKALLSADGRRVSVISPHVNGKLPVSQEVLRYMTDALTGVTDPGQHGTAGNAFVGFPRNQLVVAGKTGTAEVTGKQTTSWFASFAPAAAPAYVVVAMVEQGGTGATTAAPIVRQVYDGIFGLEGHPAAVPSGVLPEALPVVLRDGSVAAPGTAVPGPRPVVGQYGAPSPTPSASPTHVA
nr:penicillin-binding protein 2 [Actinomycetota bacterium]